MDNVLHVCEDIGCSAVEPCGPGAVNPGSGVPGGSGTFSGVPLIVRPDNCCRGMGNFGLETQEFVRSLPVCINGAHRTT